MNGFKNGSRSGMSSGELASVASGSSDSNGTGPIVIGREVITGNPNWGECQRHRERRQGIFWLLTIPHPNEVAARMERGELPDNCVWCKGQRETGANTGYEHYQVVVAFRSKKSLTAVAGVFGGGVHCELSRSEAAEAYCTKEDTRAGEPFEHGAKPFRRNAGRSHL